MAHIVLVEDDEILAELLLETLAGAGHMVVAAATAEDALGSIDHGAPDLVVVDYELPGATGLEIVRQMRARSHLVSTPIIMMTANRSNLLCARSVAEGVTDYLTKPVWPRELLARVEMLVASR